MATTVSARLGQMLVDSKIITEEQLKIAIEKQKEGGGSIGTVLVTQGFTTEDVITKFLGKQCGVEAVNVANIDVNASLLELIPAHVAQKHLVFPVSRQGNKLNLAMVNPRNIFAIDDIKFMTGLEVVPMVSAESGIKKAIDDYYGSNEALNDVLANALEEDVEVMEAVADESEADLKNVSEEAPIVRLVNSIIADAVRKGASDIHIEPYEKTFRVRFRIDGSLYDVMQPPLKFRTAITTRIKIMAELDIAERRLPQDGRIKIRLKHKSVDLRVSTLPCIFGEKIVMRILDKGNLTLDLRKLGFSDREHGIFTRGIRSPWGMCLVTGPTGSGKTTTLYSGLHEINNVDANIMTAEDPVEYNLLGINQVATKAAIGLTFAAALRSFLRQDPDVIMVGEIRDLETGEIAVKAALTGHLVLSTLHTNNAPATISRMINMGIEPFLVSSSVLVILAQRLVRRICSECKEVADIPRESILAAQMKPEDIDNGTFYIGKGCSRCSGTGYKGRMGVYEILEMNEDLRNIINSNGTTGEIKQAAIAGGMSTLRMSALRRFAAGETSMEEVLRVTMKD